MASFHAKTGWKRLRKWENKKYRSALFLPDAKLKIPKKQQKNSKIPFWLLFMQKQVAKGREREKIKIIVPFCSHPMRNRKIQKSSKKIKKKKNIIMASFQTKIGWKRLRKRSNKNYRSDYFRPDPEQRIKKKQQKNSKN